MKVLFSTTHLNGHTHPRNLKIEPLCTDKQHDKQYDMNNTSIVYSFHLNDHTLWFHLQT